MTGTAQFLPERVSSWTSPDALPAGGDWASSLRHDGVDYFQFPVQPNRTFSIAATALDESGRPTLLKVQPVVGIWAASDPEGTLSPAFTPTPFNSSVLATTRLDAQILERGNFLIGISDVRGAGRPDFRYRGRVLYGDTVSPARVSVNGGVVRVRGTGFAAGLSAAMGAASLTQFAVSGTEMMLSVPPRSDGQQTITIRDPASGASTVMTNVLTYGAAATDNIVLIYAGNSQIPVGTPAAKPVAVRVLDADGVTPVRGATIGWTTSNNLQLSACNGATSCSAITDQNGNANTWLTPAASGAATVTATLAPGVYSPPKSVTATLNATQSPSDISALTPYLWISQAATVTLPLTVRAVSNGAPRSAVQINFEVMVGSGSVSVANAQTNSNGYASVNLSITQIAVEVRVSACAAPNNAPCAIFYANPVAPSQLRLQPVSGGGQVSTGQAFQPIIVRVTDSATPANPVIAAPVVFQTTIFRSGGSSPEFQQGESEGWNPAMPVILSVSQTAAVTDANGLANLVPAQGSFSPPFELDVSTTAGSVAWLDFPLHVLPALVHGSSPSITYSAPAFVPVRKPLFRIEESR